MKIVKIEGFSAHTFIEGNGFFVDFSMKVNCPIKTKNVIKSYNNKHNINLKYSAKSDIKNTVLDQKYDQFYREKSKYKIEPFVDKKVDYKEVKNNTERFDRTVGYFDGNELFLELDEREYHDFDSLNLKEFVMLSEDDILNYVYPIKFNKTSFHRRGGRINAFDSINQIQFKSSAVDFLKGCRGFALKNGQNSLNENNIVKDFYIIDDNSEVSFEDGLLEGYIYNKNLSTIIDKINVDYNPITKESSTTFTFKEVNKISQEPRYSKFNQQSISPFKEYDHEKNNPYVVNDSQIYLNKLRDESLNNILLNNASIFNRLEEQKIYINNGKTFDRSITCGIESLVFHEGLD